MIQRIARSRDRMVAPAYLIAAAICLAATQQAHGQATSPTPAQNAAPSAAVPVQNDAAAAEEDVLELSPFTISANEDAGGYAAKSTLAGTRVRTDLSDVASAISVVTKQLLSDTGSKNSEDLLVYTPNTEVGGIYGNFSGNGGANQYNENASLLRPSENTRVRGLTSADNTRDYFLTNIPWDGYIVDRVDLQRGPNSILFGAGSPGGIVNTSINQADFKNKNTVEARVAKFGSFRMSADFNRVLIPKQLAIRVSLLDDAVKFQQTPAHNDDKRAFAAIKYEPKLFGEGSHTSIRANYEVGTVNANRPRSLPPVDAVTPWFLTGKDAYGNDNLNKAYYNNETMNKGNAPYSNVPWLNNGAVGRQFWNNVVGYYGNVNDSNPTDLRQPAGTTNFGIGPDGKIDRSIGGLPQGLAFAIASYSSYALKSGQHDGAFTADRSLADTSIFDFYNNLIDGTNSRQWQAWKAGNIAVEQSFFNNRLSLQFVNDFQRYKDGQRAFLGASDTYKMGVELNSKFIDGTFNGGDTINNATGAAGADGIGDNAGRIYVASSTEGANKRNTIDRDSVRFTATADIRSEDFADRKSLLAKILGHHEFTGLYGQDTIRTTGTSWATSAEAPSYTQLFGAPDSLTAHFRAYDFVSYISPSLFGQSSAAGARATRVLNTVTGPASGQTSVKYFDNVWAHSLNPSDPGYVNPAAPYSYQPQNGGALVTNSTQSENPANYGGWKTVPVTFLNADTGDQDALTFAKSKSQTVVKSKSITWQGHLFGDTIIPVASIRRDEISNKQGGAIPDKNTGIVSTGEFGYGATNTVSGTSKSWGIVAKLPKSISDRLPAGTTISAFFNKSENFKADALRGDVFGNPVPNPKGDTKDYGIVISTLDDRLTLKINQYETKVANATLDGGTGLGQNGYFLWAVPVWGTAFVTNADQGLKGNNDNNSWAWNYASSDDSNAPAFRLTDGSLNPAFQSHPSTVAEKAAIDAWKNLPVEQSFFNAYGNEVALINVAAMRAGNWTVADPIWNKKFDNQPDPTGNLVGYGSGPVSSVDTVSKGTEFELYAKPTKNWNLTVNASKTFASRIALAPTIASYIKNMTDFLGGPAGDIRLWGGGSGNALRTQWKNNIVNPYNTLVAQQGSNAPEIAPWRFNAITSYNIDSGKLKGSWFGGAFRWEQARVLGYQYSDALNAIDVKKPLKGSSDSHLDLWVGYSRRVSDKINWKIQVNLRNVGEKTHLVAVSKNPDDTVAFSRISEGMVWQVTNTLEF